MLQNNTDCVARDFETSRTAVEEIVPMQLTASHLVDVIVIVIIITVITIIIIIHYHPHHHLLE